MVVVIVVVVVAVVVVEVVLTTSKKSWRSTSPHENSVTNEKRTHAQQAITKASAAMFPCAFPALIRRATQFTQPEANHLTNYTASVCRPCLLIFI